MLRLCKKLFVLLLFFAFFAVAGAGAILYWVVVVDPGPEIEPSYIEGILGRESPVFYRDGVGKIGVLFHEAHRQYIPFQQIPTSFVNAIIAAEDAQFFDHFGIDFIGIARAMLANIKAGRVVQGGSTITQQTAKNLFKRESRTYRAKLKELLHALQLEYHYPKEKILEFYINQFFVSGNGHGLGVAARYYFDKDVDDLTLLENAFIAGSVKRPNYYNPFTKSSEEAEATARKRAKERAAYVLRNMRRLNFISDAEFARAAGQDIEFNRGRMSFALNTIMDLVRDGLSTPEITRALEEHGISNPSTSGIRIFTTIEKDLQEGALTALRGELSRLDIRLRGYDRQEVQREYLNLEYPGDTLVDHGAFLFGQIRSMEREESGEPLIRVDLGSEHPEARIDRQGLEKALTALVRFTRQRWSSADKSDMPLLLDQLKEGDKVYVSVRDVEPDGALLLDLERFPELQGAALVLQEGGIRAMAGGMENRYFNRAVSARRVMGSTFKPFLLTAALQLGWSPVDMLNNSRNVFVYQDIPYFPRPDHISPHGEVSMSWAGVTSENLAAIWLLYHLTDHLTPPRLREVAAHLNLAPQPDDLSGRYEYFKQRIRDQYGIVVTRDVLLQAAYDRAVKNLETDFLFAGMEPAYRKLKELPYGLHFDKYAEEVSQQLADKKLSKWERSEFELRLAILGRSYLGLQSTMDALQQNKRYFEIETSPVQALDPLAFLDSESGNLKPVGLFWRDENGTVVFSLDKPGENRTLIPEQTMRSTLQGMEPDRRREFWENVELDGDISVYAFQQVTDQMAREREFLFAEKPYSMEVLSDIRDYRILVGLQYLIHLGRETGIHSKLEPVLSFPLGSNVISLLDGVRMYETMVTGTRFTNAPETEEDVFYSESLVDGLSVIERIETINGEAVYSRQTDAKEVVDSYTSTSVADILHNTVRYGTGRYARDFVRLRSSDPERQELLDRLNLPVPLLGKTGTSNEFTNAAFFGYIPVLAEDGSSLHLPGGYTVGVYVGFDDNKPMKKGTTRITGSSGALPTWSSIAMTLVNQDDAGNRVDLADLSFNGLPLRYTDTGQFFVPVAPDLGGRAVPSRGILRGYVVPSMPAVLAYGRVAGSSDNFEPDRLFRPYWKNRQP
ncbi:MAG: transglycosylase domain-containing protein [Desulfobulbaceae bacterium]|nr:transglycosylase domain-containing protein [Desulfobulbaceae bacterium]